MILAVVYGAVTGLSLGLTGSGGSILAIPFMVYGLGLPVNDAVVLSLAVVGLIALSGAIRQSRGRHGDWKTAALFAVTGMAVSPLVLHFASDMNPQLRLVLFALLMLAAAWRMVKGNAAIVGEAAARRHTGDPHPPSRALACGVVAGALAGLFGIGGGFVIVPLLVLFIDLPYKKAVGTSLAAIFLISVSGVAYGLLNHPDLPWDVFLPFAAGGVGGMFAGTALLHKLDEKTLRRVFACVIVLLSAWMLYDNIILTKGATP